MSDETRVPIIAPLIKSMDGLQNLRPSVPVSTPTAVANQSAPGAPPPTQATNTAGNGQ